MIGALLWAVAVIGISDSSVATRQEAISFVERFDRVWGDAHEVGYWFRKRERLRDGTVNEEILRVKHRKPATFYITDASRLEGQEVLYDSGRNKRELLVHTGRFPDLNLWLDIQGRLTLKGQRHPVNHSGFSYLLGFLRDFIEGAQRGAVQFERGSTRVWKGEPVVEVEITAPGGSREVLAQKGETLFSLAARVHSDPYRLFEANPEIKKLTDGLRTGATYRVPHFYVARARLLLGAVDGVLRLYQGWDEEGRLLEDYRFERLNLLPGFRDLDFSEENPEYRF